jgi:hypothetical protein
MIWIIAIVAVVFLMSKNNEVTAPGTSATSANVTSPTIYKTASAVATPKSNDQGGYAQASPPDQIVNSAYAYDQGSPVGVQPAPIGYGYDMSRKVYTWIGTGIPPNGAWTIPFNQ